MDKKAINKTNKGMVNVPAKVDINFKFKDYDEFLNLCDKLVGNDLVPLKSKSEVAVAILAGKSLGVDMITALNNIYPVNGRATLSLHLIEAILTKNGIISETLEDFQPMYPVYTYLTNDKGEAILKPSEKDKTKSIPTVLEVRFKFRNEVTDLDKVSWKPAGYGTKIKATREILQPSGKYREMVVIETYSTIDADKVQTKVNGADATIRDKQVWINYEKDMIYASCKRRLARKIADDLLLGLYETAEMLDSNNIDYNINTEGKIEVLNKEKIVVAEDTASTVVK
jgi:hypothetical protein